MRTKLLTLFFVVFTLFAYGVDGVFYGSRLNNQFSKNENSLHNIFTSYSVYQLDKDVILQYLDYNEDLLNGKNAPLTFIFGDEFKFEMNIQVHDVRSPNFTCIENTPNGKIIHERTKAFTYRGMANGKAENVIALGICEDFISGIVTIDGTVYFIEPAKRFYKEAKTDEFIIYNAADVIPDANVSCGFTNLIEDYKNLVQKNKNEDQLKKVCSVAEIAIAADNSMIISYGTPTAVSNALTNRLNMMSLWYSSTFEIEYTIVAFYITSVPNDIVSDTIFDSSTILGNFRNWGNTGGFGVSKDISTFFTDRNICYGTDCGNIGISYIGGVCNTNGYNVLEDLGTNAATSINYWSHECGHTWNAGHTSPQNTTTFMNPIIYSTSNDVVFASTLNEITTFKNATSCLSSCVSILELDENHFNFNLYPNPSEGSISLELYIEASQELNFIITNILGQVIITENEFANVGLFQKQFDLYELSSGTYFIQIIIGNKTLNKRFIEISK